MSSTSSVPEVAHERQHPSNLALYLGILGMFLGVVIVISGGVYPLAGRIMWVGVGLLVASVLVLIIGMVLRHD